MTCSFAHSCDGAWILAPQSEESRLFAALVEQETVRLRWVTEGVELLYRLPPEQRDYWRQALATNETRTDEERYARYEEMLAGGHAALSELPFYRRVTPRRPRRTGEPPASPIPFFARRSAGGPRFPGLAAGSLVDPAAPRDPFQLAELLSVAARLMIVPCNRPADCVALRRRRT